MTQTQTALVVLVGAILLVLCASAVVVLLVRHYQPPRDRVRPPARPTAVRFGAPALAVVDPIAERSAAAAAQLHGLDPALWLPALGVLDDLAQRYPTQRAAAVDTWCAYLRQVTPSEDGHRPVVRSAVVRQLTAHLRPADGARFWPGCALRLNGAALHDLDLRDVDVSSLSCRQAHLTGTTTLAGARIRGPVDLTGTQVAGPFLAENTAFDGTVTMLGTWFDERVVFAGAVLRGIASFGGARLAGPSDFTGTVFLGPATFATPIPTRFEDEVCFRGAALGRTRWDGVVFQHRADFHDAGFAGAPPPEVAQHVADHVADHVGARSARRP